VNLWARLLLACLVVVLAFGVSTPSATADVGSVKYFGYFAARLTPSGGNHLAEVADRSNLNWVQISDIDRYRPEVLNGCKPRGCIVSTGNEFFTGCNGSPAPNCNLYPNYRERWLRLAAEVRSRIDKVGAFYIMDEPQWRGASPAEIGTAAKTIKATFPDIPVMMVEAGPKVTNSLRIPPAVDWVGFDWHCRSLTDIRSKLLILERIAPPHQGLFLVPEAAPLPECGGAPGHRTDAEIARLQLAILRLAEDHLRVIGILAFGFWTSGFDSADLPRTVAAHRQMAARIIRPPAPPPPPPAPPPAPAPAPPTQDVQLRGHRVRLGSSGFLRVAMTCPPAAAPGCAGRITIRTRKRRGRTRLLARGRFSIRAGQQRRVRLRIRRASRASTLRAARKRRGYRVVAVVKTSSGTSREPLTLVRAHAVGAASPPRGSRHRPRS
jgi:hypothetical protein